MREFETGAVRNTDDGKLNFEGALSPQVLWAFTQYMAKHSNMPDGTIRTAGNWKKGFPRDVIMECFMRHVFDLWMLYEGEIPVRPEDGHTVEWDDALGGALFNLQALWHARLTHD